MHTFCDFHSQIQFFSKSIKRLKGECHEIFNLPFFSWFYLSLINRLKYFRIQFFFGEIFDPKVISAVCNTPQRWSLPCATYRRDHLSGVQHTAETISAVCDSLRRWSPWCATYCGDKLHTAESKSKYSLVYGCF